MNMFLNVDLIFLENISLMPVSPGASGMQPRDPGRPWRGTLASGHPDHTSESLES